jgi:hypothetical protein
LSLDDTRCGERIGDAATGMVVPVAAPGWVYGGQLVGRSTWSIR